MSSSLAAEFRLAVEVPRWTWRFYLRHLPVIVGLSLVASIQRFVVVNWDEHIPTAVTIASEVLVMGVRIAMIVIVWRLATRGLTFRWDDVSAFASRHWPSLVIQGGLLSVAFLVFDLGAERLVGGLLPESAQEGYLAALLFVKNPTVIAFVFVWWVGMVRQAMRLGAREPAAA